MSINGSTKLFGLIATPVSQSLAPTVHNLSFEKSGLNNVYMAFEVGNDELKDVVKGFRALNIRGFNVSMPNKIKIQSLLDEVSPAAQFIGAVNTVVNEEGRLIGHNTDGIGYVEALKDNNVDFIGKKMTLLGAGGAANAVAIQLAIDGIEEISIFNRDLSKATRIADIANKHTNCNVNVFSLSDLNSLKNEITNSNILTNATGVGMKPLEGKSLIANTSLFHPELVVSDLIYNPRKTMLLKQAEFVGCKTINGLGMMLGAGAKSFEIWTSQKMPVKYLKEQLF
jgi:shikimate dehydrogenase